MIDFLNDVLDVYKMYIDFLFSYSLSGIPVGYIFIACVALELIIYFILHSVR